MLAALMHPQSTFGPEKKNHAFNAFVLSQAVSGSVTL